MKKAVKVQLGEVDMRVSRGYNGSHEPRIIGKYSQNADGMAEKILALYSCGLSQQDTAEQMSPWTRRRKTCSRFRENGESSTPPVSKAGKKIDGFERFL